MKHMNEMLFEVENNKTTGRMPSRYEQYFHDSRDRIEIVLPVRSLTSKGASLVSYQAAIKTLANYKESPLAGNDISLEVKDSDTEVGVLSLFSQSIIDGYHSTPRFIPYTKEHLKYLSKNADFSSGFIPRHGFILRQVLRAGESSLMYESALSIENLRNKIDGVFSDVADFYPRVVLQIFPHANDLLNVLQACHLTRRRVDIRPIFVKDKKFAVVKRFDWPSPMVLDCIEPTQYAGKPIFTFGW